MTIYRTTCKVCGAPRWYNCEYALCEAHFLEYMRINGRATYRRKMAKLGRTVIAHRQWAAQTTVELTKSRTA